jgi:hypothetical protein
MFYIEKTASRASPAKTEKSSQQLLLHHKGSHGIGIMKGNGMLQMRYILHVKHEKYEQQCRESKLPPLPAPFVHICLYQSRLLGSQVLVLTRYLQPDFMAKKCEIREKLESG